jgi:formylglycine-generating enzyme required for sulfatase activity
MKRAVQIATITGIPALAVALLLGLLMIVDPFSAHPLLAQAPGPRIGELRLADNKDSQAGDFILTLEQIELPPAGKHYELWMQSDAGPLLRLGAFKVDGGHVTFAGGTAENLLRDYNLALISLEPDDDDNEAAISQVALTSTLPSQLLNSTRQLLANSKEGAPSLFSNIQKQIAIASEQNKLLAGSLAVEDFPAVRNRAEQIVNILDGKDGDFYGDLDRNGKVQDPGDGVGVRGYLQQAIESMQSSLTAVSTTEELSTQLQGLITELKTSQSLVEQARDQAQKVFAADSKAESEAITAAVDDLFKQLREQLTAGYKTSLDLATYAFRSSSATPSPGAEASGPLHLGALHLASDAQGHMGTYALELDQMEPPPQGEHYELWMESDAGKLLRLGKFVVDHGNVTYTGSIEENLLDGYNSALISLEPDNDPDDAAPAKRVLESTLPGPFLEYTRKLLVGSTEGGPALLDNLQAQIAIASEHAGLLTDNLVLDKMDEVRRHAEHLVNILDGETGELYGDLNHDGQTQNPGDGVGVRVYLDRAHDVALELPSTISPTEALDSQTQKLVKIIEEGQPVVLAMRDRAASIFGLSDQLELLKAAKELLQSSATLTSMEQQARASALDLVSFEFFAPSAGAISSTTSTSVTATAPTAATSLVNVTPPPAATAGETWTHPLEGVPYIFLPGGEVVLGSDTDDPTRVSEKPQHDVQVGALWMRQTEVTNAQYQLCVTQGACQPPNNNFWQEAALAGHPVTYISWQQAIAYTRWAGGRLPTEAEWEYGCQGPTEQEYPWGDAEPTVKLSNYAENMGGTVPVGSYLDGASPFGLLDMSGNVWEWTSSLDQPYPYVADDGREDLDANGLRIGRGGSFGFSEANLRCSTRASFHPAWQLPHLGLRVVIDVAK